MKKTFILALVLQIALLSQSFSQTGILNRESYAAESGSAPYAITLPIDLTLGGLSLGAAAAGFLMQKLVTLPQADSLTFDLSNVTAVDAYFAQPYSKALDFTGDIFLAMNLALPVVTFGTEWLCKNFPANELLTVGLMYAETFALSWGVKNIMKVSMHRARPYMYTSVRDEAALSEGYDFEYSWPSGHSTSVFMAATFLSTVFCEYYPNSAWRIPVIAVSYSVAAGTAALRMASGNHFLTDVLTGAVLGSACGFIVPFAHKLVAKSRSQKEESNKTSVSFMPGAVNIHVAL